MRWIRRRLVTACALGCALGASSASLAPAASPGTETLRLGNGLEVVLSEAHEQPIFSTALRYRVGGRDEPADLDELAHLVEHLSFRRSRHVGHDDWMQIAERAGVSSNAWTVDDDTTFVNQGPIGALPRILWLERQRMAFVLEALTAEDVVTERRMLENERSTVRADKVGGEFWKLIAASLYPPGHPYAPREEQGCILRCDLRHAQWLMQRGYRPDNARLVVVGDFSARELLPSIQSLFGSITNPGVSMPALDTTALRTLAAAAPRAAAAAPSITIAAPVTSSGVRLLWRVPDALRSKLWSLEVLRVALELVLNSDLIDGETVASHIHVRLQTLDLGWLWSVSIEMLPGMDPKRVQQRALARIAQLSEQLLPMDLARQNARRRLLATWEDPIARTELLVSAQGVGFDLQSALAEQEQLSPEELRSLAREHLRAPPTLAVHIRRAVDAAWGGELYRRAEAP